MHIPTKHPASCIAPARKTRSGAKVRFDEETPVFRPGLFMPSGVRVDCTQRPYRRKSINRMMMGIGIPISQRSAPFPKPISSSISVARLTAGKKESSYAARDSGSAISFAIATVARLNGPGLHYQSLIGCPPLCKQLWIAFNATKTTAMLCER